MLEINEIEYCKVNVKYTATPETVIEKTKEAINELRKLPVPGFRKNKATDVAIKARYKLRIEQWVKNEMINHSYEDILFETKIEPIGQPQVIDMRLDGNNFNCEMLFLKKPEFELKEVKGLEIPKPHENVTQIQYVQELLQELRTKNGNSAPFEDGEFLQMGDIATLDYIVDGKLNEGVLYTVGHNILPEFDDNIIGMAPGEDRTFNILLDGKKIEVKVSLHMGMKKTLCPLDDELAIKVGLKNIDELRSTVEGIAGNRLKQHRDAQIADQISKRILLAHDFEVPKFLQDMEFQGLAQKHNIKLDEATDEVKADLAEKAKNSIKFALILDSVRKVLPESDLTDDEILNMLRQRILAQNSNIDPNSYLADMQKNGSLIGLVAQVRNETTLQYLIDNAKIIE
jgi:trigger factor